VLRLPKCYDSTVTNRLQYLVKSIPNSVICPEIVCPESSFVRRDDAGNCGCSNTGAGSNCDFIKCATGTPIQNPVTGHCLCPLPQTNPPEPICVRVACPLGGTAHYNSTLNSCACPTPPCLVKCQDGYRAGFDSATGACACIQEPVCPPDIVLCRIGLSYGFSELTLTCGCFPRAQEMALKSAPHQVSFKACGIQCKDGFTLDTTTCTCVPTTKPCNTLCKDGFTHDPATCTCVPIKPCNILCKDGFTLDTTTCTCIPIKPCNILCKAGTQLDPTTCTCIPIRRCDIVCKEGMRIDNPICRCVPIKACDIFCKEGTKLDTATCTCIPNDSSSPSYLPTPAGRCATFARCPPGRVAGFAPLTLECGCTNCDALHCPDNQQAQFDPASQKCYCPGVPGECFDFPCPPPEKQLVFQQVLNPDGTVSEGCACKSTL
jgi:hypothetical protein